MTHLDADPARKPRIVYISIGNSDGKLTAEQWQQYRDLTHELLTEVGVTAAVHGAWQSFVPKYVNACWCVEVAPEHEDAVKDTLRQLAEKFGQESIAYAVAETEFLVP
jgi:hypothetical protein